MFCLFVGYILHKHDAHSHDAHVSQKYANCLSCIFRFCDGRAFFVLFGGPYLEEFPNARVSDCLEDDGASSGFISKPYYLPFPPMLSLSSLDYTIPLSF